MKEWFANIIEEMLDFPDILNASIAASWMVLAVLLLRLILNKAPKWTRVALWGLVAIRLLLPFSIESAFSLIPSAHTVPEDVLRYEGIQLKEPVHLDVISNPSISGDVSIELEQTADRLQIYMIHTTFIWLIGIALLFLHTLISYWTLHRKVQTAVWYRGNVFQSENVSSPFVLGIIRPRIFVPFKMDAQDMKHVIAHEQAHLKRKDHWWKPLGFLLLAIHWFNPVMWLAYIVLCRDIELACDEKVIKELNSEQRADYTQALLSCSINRRMIAACPLAFGEVGVKERVKSVMYYKKPTFWIIIVSICICTIVAVCFLPNPKEPMMHDIYAHKGYTVLYQQPIELTLSVDKTLLPDAIYTKEGYEFEEGEVVAYQAEQTTIYLQEVVLSNESDEELYFVFNCSYNISNYGSLISPFYAKDKKGVVSTYMSLSSRDLKDGRNTYPEALSVRGQGPGEIMIFYVSKDACKAAEEKIEIPIKCNQIFYARNGYEEEASGQIIYRPQEMLPTSAKLTGAFDSYLYLPQEDENYRYERSDININTVTRDKQIHSFTEKAVPTNVDWKIYALKEYPDLSAVLAIAGKDYQYVYLYSPAKRSEPDALEKVIEAGYVVHMDGDVTNGQYTWASFPDKVEKGNAASVRLAKYYTLNRESCSEEYYEANKEDYPVLYLFDLYFDGKVYTLEWKEGNKEYARKYRYLMHYTGESPTANAAYDTYSEYVLVNDQKVSWEDIQRGMFSSQLGDYIAHDTVYVDLQ